MDIVAQRLVNNEFDSTLLMASPLIASVVRNNPNITTYAGDQPPHGHLDWWPNALWMNTQLAPYDDVRVRRALSRAIDRDKLNQLLYGGAPVATIYPFPLYPALQRFADSPLIQALEAQYQPGRFDLAESARLMTEAGFSPNAEGFWAKDGVTLNAQVNGIESVHDDVAPVLAEMLRQAGFDSAPYLSPTVTERRVAGAEGLYLYGHGASLVDPYATLAIFHSRNTPPVGQPASIDFARYSNPDYDQIVDSMATLSAGDPQFEALAAQAMEIYWRDVINIPVMQWLHRIPYNQTYWTNWPTADNPAMGTNGAIWSQTGLLLVAGLKPAQ
jgi:ABC-type transport system substrate-binding protein